MITEITSIIDSDEPTASEVARARLLRTEGGPFLINDWDDVIMVHYEVEPATLQPFVPFELDTRNGKAYVSLVSFTMRRLRPSFGGRLGRWLFSPIANHEFLNLRTYVRHDGQPGIYFLAEWLPNRLSVLLGPLAYGLPYRHARVCYTGGGEPSCIFRSGSRIWQYRARVNESGSLEPAVEGSLDEFLLERYTAFTDRGGRLGFFRIWHEPWQQTPVEVSVEEDSLPASTGDWFDHARLVGGTYSPRVRDVWIGRPHLAGRASRLTNVQSGGQAIRLTYFGWLPLILLPVMALLLRPQLPAWAFMWTLAFAIYAGCKWLTWWQPGDASVGRSLGYLLLWPGMDARGFLNRTAQIVAPPLRDWVSAAAKTAFGATLLWAVTGLLPATHPLLIGWVGMVGIIFLLHFGLFHLLSLAWRCAGVNARPIMHAPLLSTSLREFWGTRWNLGFHQLANEFVFRPVCRQFGTMCALISVFLVSGLVHDLVISVPARGGYGLPTLYFLVQAVGMIVERAVPRLRGRTFTLLVAGLPAFWLFHPPFVNRVILPFLEAIGAR